MVSAALEFKCQVDEVYTTYIDSIFGYSNLSKTIKKNQHKNIVELKEVDPEKASLEFLDEQEMCYSISGKQIVRGNTRQYKLRNHIDGSNWQWAARMFIVTVYELWEGEYRNKICHQKGLSSGKLEIPIMGDLRHLRNWIIHFKSIPDSNVNKLEVIDWCVEDQTLHFNFDRVYEIVCKLQQALEGI